MKPKYFPPHIKTIGVVAPACLIPEERLRAEIEMLEAQGIKVVVWPHAIPKGQPEDYTCAPLEDRIREFQEAWLTPEIDAILCVRGGRNAEHVIPHLDWDKLRTRPDLPVIGYSNISAILSAMLAKKAGHPYSGNALSKLHNLSDECVDHYRKTLAGEKLDTFQLIVRFQPENPQPVHGTIFAGHVTVLNSIAGTEFMPDNSGKIIFLEHSKGYSPEKILDCLKNLEATGAFKDAAAFVICQFTHEKPEDRATCEKLAVDFLAGHNVPVFSGFPYGHEHPKKMLDLRRKATITPDGTLSFD